MYNITDQYTLGGEFYRWEIATAVACSILRVNAFDQPDVQDNKTRTVNKIEQFRKTGSIGQPQPVWQNDKLEVFASDKVHVEDCTTIQSLMERLVGSTKNGDYIAISAYLPYDASVHRALGKIREYLQKKTALPVTIGFGPRFLHSTGQLHKGGANNGVFLQITAKPKHNLKLNDISFGTLQDAQALGDYESLDARGRRILRLQLNSMDIKELAKEIVE